MCLCTVAGHVELLAANLHMLQGCWQHVQVTGCWTFRLPAIMELGYLAARALITERTGEHNRAAMLGFLGMSHAIGGTVTPSLLKASCLVLSRHKLHDRASSDMLMAAHTTSLPCGSCWTCMSGSLSCHAGWYVLHAQPVVLAGRSHRWRAAQQHLSAVLCMVCSLHRSPLHRCQLSHSARWACPLLRH